jgi:hypothetical protein
MDGRSQVRCAVRLTNSTMTCLRDEDACWSACLARCALGATRRAATAHAREHAILDEHAILEGSTFQLYGYNFMQSNPSLPRLSLILFDIRHYQPAIVLDY